MRIRAILDNVRIITGIPLIFKGALHQHDPYIEPYHQYHTNPYCSPIINDMGMLPTCVNECVHRVQQTLYRSAVPYVKQCYAGITELVVPFVCNNAYQGFFCFGPLRREGDKPFRKHLESCYYSIPVYEKTGVEAMRGLLVEMVTGLAAGNGYQGQDTHGQPFSKEEQRIGRAIAFVQANFHKKICANDVAKACCLSTSRFLYLFKSAYGRTFGAYLESVRLEAAKRMLICSAMSIRTIAQEAGYPNPNYFYDVFRKNMHCTPKEFRKENAQAILP